MDQKLVGWARAVKARRRHGRCRFPVLWLFTDAVRLADPRAAVARLPRGLAGVVLRHDDDPARARLARDLAALCRARRLALAVAGDWRLAAAVRAGVHLRGGRRLPAMPRGQLVWSSSAHGRADLVRARRAGAILAFLSPAFATASHPGAPALGTARWSLAAQSFSHADRPGGVAALGGITGANVRRLPYRLCCGAAAIGALRAG